MPVQIGEKIHSFSDPTGLLSDCHRRIETFMASLEAVAALSNRELTDEMSRSLDSALRYFRDAAPKHTADEEESLFPRLRQAASPELHSTLNRLNQLQEDHRWAELLHATVDQLGNRYLEQRRLLPEEAKRFRHAIDQLSEMYQRHIELEDREVFPAAARLLTPQAKREVANEMKARRNLKAS